jgi:hypothetical protein
VEGKNIAMLDTETVKGFLEVRYIIAVLLVFVAGMGSFAVVESYGKPDHPLGKFVQVCYEDYAPLCFPVHITKWLGAVLFFPVGFTGYINRFASSSDYYTLAVPYWLIVSCLVVFAYYSKKKGIR